MPKQLQLDQLYAAFKQAPPAERARLLAGIAALLLRDDAAVPATALS